MYLRKTIAEISLQALASNYLAIKSLLKPQTKFVAMVKANGYGHGAIAVAREYEKLGVDMLGVACVYEVAQLREAGIKLPIFNVAPTFADEAEAMLQYDYEATVFSLDIAEKISAVAQARGKIAKIHVKVDTGMGRIGAAAEDVIGLVREIKKLPNIEIVGLFTHLANADVPSSEATKIQLKIFNKVLRDLENAQIKIPLIHAANSAGAVFWPESHFDMVRVGMSLYGYSPSDDENLPMALSLEPVMSLRSYISHIKIVAADTPISYGWTYRTKSAAKIATIAVGYGDGLRRAPQNWGEVLCGGKRVPIVGRVCMDQMMIDVSAVKNACVGDEIILIGKQGNEKISAWDVAKKSGTSVYEILPSVAMRVTRTYIK